MAYPCLRVPNHHQFLHDCNASRRAPNSTYENILVAFSLGFEWCEVNPKTKKCPNLGKSPLPLAPPFEGPGVDSHEFVLGVTCQLILIYQFEPVLRIPKSDPN